MKELTLADLATVAFGTPSELPNLPALKSCLAESLVKTGRCATENESVAILDILEEAQKETQRKFDEITNRCGTDIDPNMVRNEVGSYMLESISQKFGSDGVHGIQADEVMAIVDANLILSKTSTSRNGGDLHSPYEQGSLPWLDVAIERQQVAEFGLLAAAHIVATDRAMAPLNAAIIADSAVFQCISTYRLAVDEDYTPGRYLSDSIKRFGAGISTWIKNNSDTIYTGATTLLTTATTLLFGPAAALKVSTLADSVRKFCKQPLAEAIAHGVRATADYIAEKAKGFVQGFIRLFS